MLPPRSRQCIAEKGNLLLGRSPIPALLPMHKSLYKLNSQLKDGCMKSRLHTPIISIGSSFDMFGNTLHWGSPKMTNTNHNHYWEIIPLREAVSSFTARGTKYPNSRKLPNGSKPWVKNTGGYAQRWNACSSSIVWKHFNDRHGFRARTAIRRRHPLGHGAESFQSNV